MPGKCEVDDCEKQAYYGIPDEPARRCAAHKENGWVYKFTSQLCQNPDCGKQAHFGDVGDERASFCKSHSSENMVDLKHKRCQGEGCNVRANYGKRGQPPSHCVSCKEPGMIHLSNERNKLASKCAHNKCSNKRQFGITRQGPSHCADHQDDLDGELIDFGVMCTVCSTAEGARELGEKKKNRKATHGVKNTVIMTHCKECAPDDLVDLNSYHKKNGLGAPPTKKRKTIYV